jgi:hypothetical protein
MQMQEPLSPEERMARLEKFMLDLLHCVKALKGS